MVANWPTGCGQVECDHLAVTAGCTPHLLGYWLTPEPDEQFDEKVADINGLYEPAPALAAQGERVISTDDLPGVQALERQHPGLLRARGKVEQREFE